MKFVLAVLLSLLSTTVYAADISPHPLGLATLRGLENLPQYQELEALYKSGQGGWFSKKQPARQRRMALVLKRLRDEALSATTINPDSPVEMLVNYINHNGKTIKLTSVVPRAVNTDEAVRNDVGGMIARFIIDDAVNEGLLPFDLPPVVQKNVDAAMKAGYAAAEQKDYRAAIDHFEKARALAPQAADVYYNLALAEAQIQGRELRAIVWFGAYLGLDPTSAQAPAIKEQIKQLNKDGLTRFISLIMEISSQTPDQRLKDIYLEEITDLWARAGNYTLAFQAADSVQSGDIKATTFAKIAGAQARDGDTESAIKTAMRILDVTGKSTALLDIADAQLSKGDMEISSHLIGAIEDPFYHALGMRGYAKAQREANDKTGALQTLKEAIAISSNVETQKLKNVMQQTISYEQARAGDYAAALKTANNIPDAFEASFAKENIARAMAMASDWDDAKRVMKEALEKAKEVPEDSRGILLRGSVEQQAQIEAYNNKSFTEEATVLPAPSISLWAWTNINDTTLNEPFFLDLSAYMKALAKDNESKMWEPLKAMAVKMVETHETIERMFKEQEKYRATL